MNNVRDELQLLTFNFKINMITKPVKMTSLIVRQIDVFEFKKKKPTFFRFVMYYSKRFFTTPVTLFLF